MSKERTRHMSNFSMGCDVADVNNDALPDIMVLDMTADDHQRNKTNMGSMSPRAFWTIVASGQQHQYMLNSLQLNNGNGTFSEIAQLAGVARTDWSWAPLLADLDNDGWKDLMVTNGFKHDIRNNDYQQQVYQKLKTGADFYKSLDLVPSSRLRNYLFRNNGADDGGRARLSFADSSQAWGFTEPVNSNGAAYADLDNDGDLDLVINNIDAPASVYANSARQQHPDRHYVRFDLCHGKSPALNTRVVLRHGGTVQYQELSPVRGYQSSVESVVHFGLGRLTAIDSVEVFWPNGKHTLLRDVKADQLVTVKQEDAMDRLAPRALPAPFFASADALLPKNWQHREDAYDDFQLEVLLPHNQSENGLCSPWAMPTGTARMISSSAARMARPLRSSYSKPPERSLRKAVPGSNTKTRNNSALSSSMPMATATRISS
ncbi:MAG: CRTAC1 family protein [Flavobacteriales bacterium]|nr:CRTAC1 family protein [Flavobacteriales bacterium]